jgi:FkbM family methyltransferase
MNRLQFYFRHSLLGYFYRRSTEKWFPPPLPAQLDVHGVTLQIDCLPARMQKVLIAGHYELHEIEILPQLIAASDQVLEIGAAIGLIGLFCRKIIKVKSLVSVEPNPTTLTHLRRNYDLNGLTPNVIEAALAPNDGPITFHTNDMFWADSLIANPLTKDSKSITVEGLSFASLTQRAGMEFNTLIMDVEGGEQYISGELIPGHVKKILIEIHPQFIGNRKAYGVLESLICSGFKIQGNSNHCWALTRA